MRSIFLLIFMSVFSSYAQDSTRLDSVENVINDIKAEHLEDSALIAERDSIIVDLLLDTAKQLEAENTVKDKERTVVIALISIFIIISIYNHRRKDKNDKKLHGS